jgi:hypothetical protein
MFAGLGRFVPHAAGAATIAVARRLHVPIGVNFLGAGTRGDDLGQNADADSRSGTRPWSGRTKEEERPD